MRRYGLFDLLLYGAVGIARYIADERRERRGEMQRGNWDSDTSRTHSLDYIEEMRTELENIKYARENTERQQREKYNFSNRDAGMDDLYAPPADNNGKKGGSGSGGF